MKESLGSFWDEWEKETELEEKKLKEMQDKIHKQYLENMQEEKQMKQEQIRKMQKRYNFSIEDERIQIALERLESLALGMMITVLKRALMMCGGACYMR